jgi:hypothetical protein
MSVVRKPPACDFASATSCKGVPPWAPLPRAKENLATEGRPRRGRPYRFNLRYL